MAKRKITFSVSLGILLITAVSCGALFSKFYWGYWFTRPHSLISNTAELQSSLFFKAKVLSSSNIELNFLNADKAKEAFDWHREFCSTASEDYYCLVARAFKSDQLLFSDGEIVAKESVFRFLKSEVEKRRISTSTDEDPLFGHLDGVLAILQDNGVVYYYFAMIGGEYASDSYPYYEHLVDSSEGEKVKSSNFFWYEKAGIEGFEWYYASLVIFIVFGIPLALLNVSLP